MVQKEIVLVHGEKREKRGERRRGEAEPESSLASASSSPPCKDLGPDEKTPSRVQKSC
jgi:hypothetical protein